MPRPMTWWRTPGASRRAEWGMEVSYIHPIPFSSTLCTNAPDDVNKIGRAVKDAALLTEQVEVTWLPPESALKRRLRLEKLRRSKIWLVLRPPKNGSWRRSPCQEWSSQLRLGPSKLLLFRFFFWASDNGICFCELGNASFTSPLFASQWIQWAISMPNRADWPNHMNNLNISIHESRF